MQRLTAALADRYRIERELGAGGMATVYLAHDLKHDRQVAVKVLRPELAAVIGADRFVSEIKTTANLQHPHILPLFDSGAADSFLFYVMPYVEGESLRDRLTREKQLSIPDAVRIASEVASALDYAHRHGVIHRDIKPENILLHDSSALVADFGIALAASKAGSRMTETGMSLGTPHYMSPEQAMGEREITARSDVYALGCVLYEMLVGQPPFTGATAQAIVAKVVTEKPAALIPQRDTVPEPVEDAVLTALAKLPADRFASAADFATALHGAGSPLRSQRHPAAPRSGPATIRWAAIAATCLVIGAGGFLLGRGRGAGSDLDHVAFTQRTFSTEAVFTARFASDGETIVYSAAAQGSTPRLYVIRSDYPEPRPIGDSATHLLSVSSHDELAVLVQARWTRHHRVFSGTLARMPLGGGAPRELLANVRDADWAPNGSDLAIIHEVAGKDHLEYPIGKVLYESAGYLSDLRFAPDGKQLAFLEHPTKWDDRGAVAVVDLAGTHRILSDGYWGLEGLGWAPDGKSMLFGGALEGGFYQVHSVTLGGKGRLVLPSAGTMTLQDVSHTGHWLLTRDDLFFRLMVKRHQDPVERDLSWLDNTSDVILSADGELLAFGDEAADAGANYATMMRKTDGSPATRLGEGGPRSVSADRNWILAVVPTNPQQLFMYPTGPGQSRRIDHGELDAYAAAALFPDGRNLLVCGSKADHAARCYVRPLAEGPLRPVTPDGVAGVRISPDGSQLLAWSPDSGYRLYPVDGSASKAVTGITAGDQILRWSPDGRALWIQRPNDTTVQVEQFELATGRRTALVSIHVSTRAGLLGISGVLLADDPQTYAYSASEHLSHIFEVRGMH